MSKQRPEEVHLPASHLQAELKPLDPGYAGSREIKNQTE